MPIKAYYLNPDGEFTRDLSPEQILSSRSSGKGLLWVDVSDITEDDGRFLEENFKFHHLAVEDCISPLIHPPKIDPFRDYIFIIVHGINHSKETDIVETAELGIFL